MTLGKSAEAVVSGYLGFKSEAGLRSSCLPPACHLLPPHSPALRAHRLETELLNRKALKASVLLCWREEVNFALDRLKDPQSICSSSRTAGEAGKLGKPTVAQGLE